jgi:hypothetical protein
MIKLSFRSALPVVLSVLALACGAAPSNSDADGTPSVDASSVHSNKWCVFCDPGGGGGGGNPPSPSGDGWGPADPQPGFPSQPGDPTPNDPTGSGGNGSSPGANGGVGGGGGGKSDPSPGPEDPPMTYDAGQVLPGTPPSAGDPKPVDTRPAAQCRARCQRLPIATRADCLSEC